MRFDDLKIGQFYEMSRVFTQQEVMDFAQLSYDTNPIHTDADYAKTTQFGQLIVPGFLISSRSWRQGSTTACWTLLKAACTEGSVRLFSMSGSTDRSIPAPSAVLPSRSFLLYTLKKLTGSRKELLSLRPNSSTKSIMKAFNRPSWIIDA